VQTQIFLDISIRCPFKGFFQNNFVKLVPETSMTLDFNVARQNEVAGTQAEQLVKHMHLTPDSHVCTSSLIFTG